MLKFELAKEWILEVKLKLWALTSNGLGSSVLDSPVHWGPSCPCEDCLAAGSRTLGTSCSFCPDQNYSRDILTTLVFETQIKMFLIISKIAKPKSYLSR